MSHPASSCESSPKSPLPRRRRPLAALKTAYAAVYSVDGALLPFLSVLLAHQHGLSAYQVGAVLGISGIAAMVGPPLATLLADSFGKADRLLAAGLLLSALSLLAFAFVDGYWWVLTITLLYHLVREPTRPLLDGIYFSAQHHDDRVAGSSYHKVRFWGTAGFLVPGVVMYFVLGGENSSLIAAPLLAAALAVLSVLIVPSLPAGAEPYLRRLPLRETARTAWTVLRRPAMAVFVFAMFCVQAALTAYMAFYPLQATDEIGLDERWLGPLTVVGVAAELVYMAAFGRLVRSMGWRWFMVTGALLQAARAVALALFPVTGTLIAAQLVHGMVIVVTMVGARTLLDRHASDAVRYTIQGFYVMFVFGAGRIAGNWLGGALAEHSLTAMFWAVAACCAAAVVMLVWALGHLTKS